MTQNSTEEFPHTGDESGPDWYIDPNDDKTWIRTTILIVVALIVFFGWGYRIRLRSTLPASRGFYSSGQCFGLCSDGVVIWAARPDDHSCHIEDRPTTIQ